MRPNGKKFHCETDGKETVIRLLHDELKYSIDYATWKSAQTREEDRTRFEMQTDEENSEWMTRSVSEAVNAIKKVLGAYTVHRSRMQTNECESKDEWTVHLMMEDGWQGSAERLASLMHLYVVESVLSKWYMMTLPEMAGQYAADAEKALESIIDEARACDIEGVTFRL